MHVAKDTLLAYLPPFNNRLVLIEPAQDVSDIVKEVGRAHKYFASDYDTIYQFFDKGSLRDICKALFDFCKENVAYVVEGEKQQTTKSPAAILAQGFGDCKHYAGFIAGVLSAISRNTGKKIGWVYRFASYSILNPDPGHVYVVVTDRGNEISIDPVLKKFNEPLQPQYIVDKKIKDMPLYSMSGVPARVGIDPITIAQTALSFIKLFTGDKVPNYPISSPDTLEKIRTQIQGLLPLPPTSLENAQMLLEKAKQLQAPLIGDTDNVRKTYYMIYGEVITALENYIAQYQAGNIDPATGLPRGGMLPTGGTFWEKNKTLILLGGAGVAGYFLLKKKRRVTGLKLNDPKTIALLIGAVLVIKQMNKPPAVTTGFYAGPGANAFVS